MARAGEVCLQPGDCLALRRPPDEAPPLEAGPEAEHGGPSLPVVDHPSMGKLRPSGSGGALTLYDCLRAFSER